LQLQDLVGEGGEGRLVSHGDSLRVSTTPGTSRRVWLLHWNGRRWRTVRRPAGGALTSGAGGSARCQRSASDMSATCQRPVRRMSDPVRVSATAAVPADGYAPVLEPLDALLRP